MYVALSLFVIALGAVLRWAVSDSIEGVALAEVGLILLVVGAVGLVVAVIAEVFGRRHTTERIIEGGGRPAERERIREQV